MNKKILFLFVYLCVSLLSVAQDALCIYPREGVDSLPIAFRVFGRMTYSENSFDITHRGGWLLYTSPYDDVQHISFIEHQPIYTTVFDTICAGEAYTWNGIEYKKPGVYIDTLQNIYGCDSIVELRLEVLPDPALTFTVNGVSFNMMRVRAGSFMMGATPEQGDDALANEKPAHQVILTRDYFIAETMLTQELWTAVMGTTIQEEEAKRSRGEENLGYGPNYPMYCLSHNDCLDFVEKLNALTGLTFRMPTEAEWEYAARGGHLSKGYKYPGSNDPLEVAWSDVNAPDRKLREVKLLKPNELGVYDMAGNVWEYIYDYRRTYTADAQVDPLGDIDGNMANIRGGSTAWDTGYNRVSCRYATTNTPKTDKSSRRAFRFVLDADRVIGEDNTTYQVYDTICAGETYTWNGNTYSRPGVYVDTLQNIYGCDSIVELRLEVLPDPALTFTVNGVSFNMMRVRAGSFMMGATPEQGDDALASEKPAHQVTLTRDYFIAETMLTQELWTAVMGTTIQEEEKKGTSTVTGLGYGDNYPMYPLSYNDCFAFVEKLNGLTGLTFRMPTEAEWEYAARGGHLSKGYKYPGSDNPDEVAWTKNTVQDQSVRPVKLLRPNELGVYDMAGNVWEWVLDYNRVYTSEPQVDPMGEVDRDSAFLRGGSTYRSYSYQHNRVSYRGAKFAKTYKNTRVGFRFVLDADRVIGEDNTTYQVFDTICSGETYTWNGREYTKPGIYTDTLQNIYGCDSIVELRLEVLPDPALTFTVNGVSFNMRRVRAGSFMMGATEKDTEAEADEFPRHEVTLTKDFFIGETEMTQELWTAIMGTNPSADKSNPQSPVNMVTWDDCQQMIAKLNQLTGLTFRLPTEAEWEYAARGGQYSKGYKYAGSDNIDEVAWYNKSYLTSVASLKPNELGLYDMSGSVYEWCQDYFNPNFYSSPNHQIDPFQSESVDGKWCLRGGSNEANQGVNRKKYSRIANRGHGDGTKVSSSNAWGLRLALEATGILENNSVFVTYDTICSGETYTWNGNTYSRPGVYVDTLQNIYGCDSIVELHLTVHPSYNNHETVVACGSYEFNPFNIEGGGRILNESGIYSDTIATIHGCDSIATIDLTVMPEAVTTTETAVIGSNELPYIWRNKEYNATGIYSDIEKYASAECDSAIHVLNLTVLTTGTVDRQSLAVCESELPYVWYGQTLTSSGEYTHIEKYAGTTIDSVEYVLNLTVNYSAATAFDTIVCDTYTWEGTTYTASCSDTKTLQTVNGCDSVVTMNLTVNYSAAATFDTTVCDVFTWEGTTYTASCSDTKTLQTIHGCDSVVTMNLTVNYSAATTFDTTVCDIFTWEGTTYTLSCTDTKTLKTIHGCDSVVTMNLIVNYSTTTAFDTIVCDTYTWEGTTYTSSCTDTKTLQTIHGCDSVVTMNLTVNYSASTEFDTIVCDTYTWEGTTYTASCTYTKILQTIHGCDSVVTMNLIVNYSASTEFDTIVCDAYTWEGTTYTSSCTDTKTLKTIHGCDSIVTMNLTVNYSVATAFDTIVCDTYTWEGTTYTASCSDTKTLQTVNGCDSIVTMNLTINYSAATAFDTIVCDTYTWEGSTYTSSCTDTKILKTIHGCDSVVTMNLTVNYSAATAFDTIVCDTYTWEGSTYTASCTDTKTLQTIHGCDSVVTMNLTVNYSASTEFDTIVCDTYTWEGTTYTASCSDTKTLQTVNGCDSIVTMNLTINYSAATAFDTIVCDTYTWEGSTYTSSCTDTKILKTIHGCDSVVTMNLTVNYSAATAFDTIVCDTYTWEGTTYTASCTDTKTLQTILGCDSVVTMHLTVNYRDTAYFTETVCNSYEWHGNTYTTSGIYYYNTHTTKGCDSVEVLTLTINNSVVVPYTVIACDSYTWSDGNTYTESGVYYDSLQTIHGCDSVEVLTLTINNSVVVPYTVTACDSYTWSDGNTYTESGVYYDSLQTIHGCDSVEVLTLTINNSVVVPYTVIACDSYTWSDGNTYTESGVYYDSLQTIHGCDSVEVLTLTINNSVVVPYTVTACDSYTWSDGNTYTESGVYYDSLQTIHGCDSVEVLTLTINNSVVVPYTVTACDSYTWSDGNTYTESGVYYDSLQTIHGCDSVEVLTLTINNSVVVPYTVTACDSYTWSDGNTYTESGVYYDSLQTIHGCDSVEVLTLTINNSVVVPYTVTACDSYTWSDGNTYTESGVYYDSLQTIHGCDSVEVLTLIVNYRDTAYFAETVCDSYEWHGNTYTTSGVYHYNTQTTKGCDSVEVLNLTVKYTTYFAYDTTVCGSYVFAGEELVESGIYVDTTVNAVGCDSIVTLNLIVNPITPTEYVYDTICSDELPYIFNDSVYELTGVYTQYYQNQYGCDSNIVLTLEVVERLVVEVDSLPNLCADDGELVINFDVMQGEFDSLQIRFVNDTVPSELYTQTIYDNSISEVVYTFDSTIWVDSYMAQLEFYQHTSCGNQVFELPFDIQYDASIIVQKWDYFLALQNANYNGGYTFTDYQWYKNGEPIPGETGASLHQYLDSTAYYYAVLTRDDGLVMRTCDYRPNVKLGLPQFPTLVRVLQNIYVANTTYSAPIETITIYSELGQLVSATPLVNGEGNVVMPGIEGNYVVKIQTIDGQIISQLLIVLW